MPESSGKRFTFITGPHRSGTSLVAGMLAAAGVKLGEQFIQANPENPKGFFEDEAVVNFNDRLLRALSLSWDSLGFCWDEDYTASQLDPYRRAAGTILRQRFAGAGCGGLKDPRFCLLLPFWQPVVEETLDAEVLNILVVRDPLACAASQASRSRKDSDFHLLGRQRVHVVLLWLTYVRKALLATRGRPLLVASYDSLLARPEEQLSRLVRYLGVDVTREKLRDICGKFIDPTLNRSQLVVKALPGRHAHVAQISAIVYEKLLDGSRAGALPSVDVDTILSLIDSAGLGEVYLKETQAMYGYAYRKVINLRHRILLMMRELDGARATTRRLVDEQQVLSHRHRDLQAQYDDLQARHDEILGSRAWRVVTLYRRCLAYVRPSS